MSGSGCDSVGWAVDSITRGLRFESSHWQNVTLPLYCQLHRKDENKEKTAGLGPFKKMKMSKFNYFLFVTRWRHGGIEDLSEAEDGAVHVVVEIRRELELERGLGRSEEEEGPDDVHRPTDLRAREDVREQKVLVLVRKSGHGKTPQRHRAAGSFAIS